MIPSKDYIFYLQIILLSSQHEAISNIKFIYYWAPINPCDEVMVCLPAIAYDIHWNVMSNSLPSQGEGGGGEVRFRLLQHLRTLHSPHEIISMVSKTKQDLKLMQR